MSIISVEILNGSQRLWMTLNRRRGARSCGTPDATHQHGF
jgi:hypothetical protein